jgi:hypothetical protein
VSGQLHASAASPQYLLDWRRKKIGLFISIPVTTSNPTTYGLAGTLIAALAGRGSGFIDDGTVRGVEKEAGVPGVPTVCSIRSERNDH